MDVEAYHKNTKEKLERLIDRSQTPFTRAAQEIVKPFSLLDKVELSAPILDENGLKLFSGSNVHLVIAKYVLYGLFLGEIAGRVSNYVNYGLQ
jgi:hypothetical protein